MVAGRPQIPTGPRKPFDASDAPATLSKFLHKALVVVVVVILVPLFPSRAPEFINQSLFARGWEFLHLLFVGIALCYGLFSRRNDKEEPRKETLDGSFETSVSRFLQASSFVFNDQLETLDGPAENSTSSSVRSWSSQYSRNEPVVVVAAGEISSAANGDGESRGMVSRRSMRTRVIGLNDKPLLLPVRSLKCARVFDYGQVDGNPLFRRSNSNSNSIRASNEGGGDSNVVLRSPIPWQSRSGRMEMKEQAEGFDVADEYAFRSVVRSRQQRAIKSDSANSTPKSLSPSTSTDLPNMPSGYTHLASPESLAREVEDDSKRKSPYKPSPPPAPPLPPPKYHKRESQLMYSKSGGGGGSQMGMESEKEFTRVMASGECSSTSVREEMMRRLNSRNSGSNSDNGLIVGKFVRTARTSESLLWQKAQKEAGTEGYWKDVMEASEKPTRSERNLSLSNQLPICNEKSYQEMDIPQAPLGKEEKVVPEDIVTLESDCESESEDEDQVSECLSSFRKGEPQPANQAMPDFGPDVDKKADEFIAKFREQIRLQRIESIKRSTYQATRKVT